MRILVFIIVFALFGCQQKSPQQETLTDSTAVEVTEEDMFADPEQVYDYSALYGTHDHESTTKGFGAVLTIRQNGNDLYFYVSVSQGTCKGEAEGNVIMVEHTENYYTGFYHAENCMLQFTFILAEAKIDIKEVNICTAHGANCSFEGAYVKRKD